MAKREPRGETPDNKDGEIDDVSIHLDEEASSSSNSPANEGKDDVDIDPDQIEQSLQEAKKAGRPLDIETKNKLKIYVGSYTKVSLWLAGLYAFHLLCTMVFSTQFATAAIIAAWIGLIVKQLIKIFPQPIIKTTQKSLEQLDSEKSREIMGFSIATMGLLMGLLSITVCAIVTTFFGADPYLIVYMLAQVFWFMFRLFYDGIFYSQNKHRKWSVVLLLGFTVLHAGICVLFAFPYLGSFFGLNLNGFGYEILAWTLFEVSAFMVLVSTGLASYLGFFRNTNVNKWLAGFTGLFALGCPAIFLFGLGYQHLWWWATILIAAYSLSLLALRKNVGVQGIREFIKKQVFPRLFKGTALHITLKTFIDGLQVAVLALLVIPAFGDTAMAAYSLGASATMIMVLISNNFSGSARKLVPDNKDGRPLVAIEGVGLATRRIFWVSVGFFIALLVLCYPVALGLGLMKNKIGEAVITGATSYIAILAFSYFGTPFSSMGTASLQGAQSDEKGATRYAYWPWVITLFVFVVRISAILVIGAYFGWNAEWEVTRIFGWGVTVIVFVWLAMALTNILVGGLVWLRWKKMQASLIKDYSPESSTSNSSPSSPLVLDKWVNSNFSEPNNKNSNNGGERASSPSKKRFDPSVKGKKRTGKSK